MSTTSKVILGSSFVFTIGIIAFVHTSQQRERQRMREGVMTDVLRQQSRKIQNTKLLQDQISLTKTLKQMEKDVEKSWQKQQ